MSFFAEMVAFMSEAGLFHLFFPWLLLLTFTYGALQKYEIFEEPSINGAVAVAFSFLAIGGVYFAFPETLFTNFAAVLAFASFVALGFLIVMAVAGIDLDSMTEIERNIPLAAGALILGGGLLIVLVSSFGITGVVENIDVDTEAVDEMLMPLLLLGFILAVVYIASS